MQSEGRRIGEIISRCDEIEYGVRILEVLFQHGFAESQAVHVLRSAICFAQSVRQLSRIGYLQGLLYPREFRLPELDGFGAAGPIQRNSSNQGISSSPAIDNIREFS